MKMRTHAARAAHLAVAYARWLVEPRLFWLATAVVVGAVALAAPGGATEFDVRAIGAALQLFGVGTVALGVRRTRRLFGHPGIVESTCAWWGRRPRLSGRVGVLAAHVTLGQATARARGHVTRNAPPGASIEERTTALEQNVSLIHERISQTQADIDRVEREHRERLEGEERVRAEGDAALRKLVEATETGGLDVSAVGATWLAVGVVLTSFAPELAGWFGR